jgi:hypothetical protein
MHDSDADLQKRKERVLVNFFHRAWRDFQEPHGGKKNEYDLLFTWLCFRALPHTSARAGPPRTAFGHFVNQRLKSIFLFAQNKNLLQAQEAMDDWVEGPLDDYTECYLPESPTSDGQGQQWILKPLWPLSDDPLVDPKMTLRAAELDKRRAVDPDEFIFSFAPAHVRPRLQDVRVRLKAKYLLRRFGQAQLDLVCRQQNLRTVIKADIFKPSDSEADSEEMKEDNDSKGIEVQQVRFLQ